MSHWRTLFGTLLAMLFAAHLAFAAPATVDISSSASATANSSQRKTFFDTENEVHWAFYYNGTAIEYSYSADGVAWTSAGTLAYNTASFAVSFKVIAATPYVFLVSEANSYDIVLRRGALTATSVVFAAEQTVYNGTAVSDHYRDPTIALNGSNNIWVSSLHATLGYQAKVRRSTNSATGDLSLWEAASSIDESFNKINKAVVISKSGAAMYMLVSTGNEQLNGYIYDGTNWSAANTGGDYSWFDLNNELAVDGNVTEIVLDGSDIYVAGDFTSIGGNSDAKYIARFDGNSWHELAAGLNGIVYTLYKDGADIYVGGRFTNGGGQGSDRIARWSTADMQWYPVGAGISNNDINAITKLGDYLYVGGTFTNGGGTGSDRAVRWNLDTEQWEALGSGLNNSILAVAVVGVEVYFGGSFTNGGGTGSDRIVRWDSVTEQWEAIGVGINNNLVLAFAVSGTDLYVGGTFTNVGNASGDGVVRLNTTNNTWSSLGTGIAVSAFVRVSAITISGANVYAMGNFVNAGGNAAADYFAHWNGAAWNVFAGGAVQNVFAMAISGTDFYCGGSFTNLGGVANADGFAKWNGTTWSGFSAYDGLIFNAQVNAIAVIGTDVFIGGEFTNVAGIAAADSIVRYDGVNWHALGVGLNSSVFSINAVGTDLYITGGFTNAGGTGATGIVRWDSVAEQWHALGAGVGGGKVAVMGNDIFVAGGGDGGTGSNDIVRWNSTAQQWEGLGVGVGGDIGEGLIYAIAVVGTNVYVGGGFTEAGGAPAIRVARWDTNTSQWYPLGAGVNSVVYYMFSEGTDVYFTGHFTDAGGIQEADGIVRYDGSNWHALGAGIETSFLIVPVTSAMFYKGDLYISGGFQSADGDVNIYGAARWDGSNWHSVEEVLHQSSALIVAGDVVYRSGYFLPRDPFFIFREVVANDFSDESELTVLNDNDGNIHLAYTNDSELFRFRRFDQSDASWGDAVTLSSGVATSPALSRNESRNLVTAVWAEANAVTYRAGQSPFAPSDWSAPLSIYNTGSNAAVTLAATQATDDLLLHWTNGAANPYSVLSDFLLMTVAPTVAISSSEVSPTKNIPIPLTIEFSANVTGFAVGDVVVTNGSKSNFVAVDGDSYTLDVTPTAEGLVTVDVATAAAEDAFGNDNTAATQYLITYDSTAPTVAISSSAANPTRTSPISVTIEFSETVVGFVVGDVAVTNGTAGNFVAVDGNTYSVDVTPTAEGDVTIGVGAAVAADAAANDNVAADALVVVYDVTSPTVVISSTASNPTPISPIPVAFEFSEPVTGFVIADIAVTNAVVGNFVAVDGDTYTAKISPMADGIVSVAVAAAVAQDAAGNLSLAATTLSRNYQSPDSDGDGVSDATEINDGTKITDSGSFLAVLPTQWCSEWNGYFGMLNVNEYMNHSENSRSIVATLFDLDGAASSAVGFEVGGQQQVDFLVHGMQGWGEDTYGKVCTEVSNAEPGDVDGRMVYYKANATGYDFAFALPYYAGLPGSQFVTFNNMQPSRNSADADNLVGNWVQLTNLESSAQAGELVFYNQQGEVLASEAITLLPETRRDYSAHHLGRGIVGLVKWQPQSTTAKFALRNTRYYYDNSEMEDSFAAGLQLEGMKGNGEVLSAVLDTRQQEVVLEIANTTASGIMIGVDIYNAAGERIEAELFAEDLYLDGYSSGHFVVNGLLNDELGSVTINGSAPGSVVAVAMHYGKTSQSENFAINHAYAVLAREALGTTVRGSYNTYLEQGCELQLVNTSSSSVTSNIEMNRLDGTPVLSGHEISTAAKATSSFDLCAAEEADQYGVVTVSAGVKNTVIPQIVRRGANGDYRFVTPVR